MVLAGMAGLAAAGSSGVRADDASASPVAHGVLANNPLALAFEPARSDLPDVTLIGGKERELGIDEFKGKTILMPLWAEWCAPCLSELPDFARLQQKYGGANFAIVPVLTGTHKQMTTTVLGEVLAGLRAGVFEPIMEKHLGGVLMNAMARTGNVATVPCNLLIAPDGHVVGREIGVRRSADEVAMLSAGGEKTGAAARSDLITRAEAGETLSLWGKAEGEQFAAAMANGFLTKA
jgi:thiol-disulfide isomerase/thioredoxin